MTQNNQSANRQIARAAGTVMLAFILANLVGLVRQILVANAFGTQADMEAFNAANRVSETLFNLIAGGALASAFIPVFTGLLAKDEKKDAWKLASSIANLLLIIFIVIAIFAAVFAPWIVRNVLAPGFSVDPAKEALTISLLRLMLPSAVIFGLSGLVMGILNSNQVFFIPALAPAMYQLGLIFGVLVLSPSMGIYGLGWGVILGSAMHLLLQIPSLLGLHGRYFPTLGLQNPQVREVGRLIGPRLLGVAVVQLNFWVNTRLASHMTEGSVTGVVMAFTLMLMPQAIIAQSIAIAAMPTFSAQVALGKFDEMRSSLAASLRGVLLLSIPATVGLILLREPVIRLLFQRGEFTARSTELVSWALLWYAVGLVSHGLVEILARAFYSLHDTKTPVFVGILAMSLNVVFSYAFAALFERLGWMPHGGLALANSLATTLEMGALIYLMRRRLGGLKGRQVLSGLFQAVFAALLMSIALWLWMGVMNGRSDLVYVLGGVIIGGIVFALAAVMIRVPEALVMVKLIKNRL